MEGEARLFLGAPSALLINAHYVLGEGWVLVVTVRRQYETWDEARTEQYDHLTTDELESVLHATFPSVAAQEGW